MSVKTTKKSQRIDSSSSTMTGEELSALGDIGRSELVKGELIRRERKGVTDLFF